jgi:hypothetical protein
MVANILMNLAFSSLSSRHALQLRRLSLLVVPLVALTAGCHDRLYDFGGTLKPLDGGAAGTSATDSGLETHNPDGNGVETSGQGGAGGMAGQGGAGQGGSGAGGTGIQQCDDKSPERQTDLANCGKCFNICIAPNSDPQCIGGACQYTCQGGFFDADKDPKNGCECVKSGDIEVCDGMDNNCNGTVDEGFDFQGDVNNCGGCNKRCSYPFAKATCDLGVCKQGACLAGFYDRDPLVPGCETACAKTNGGVEICDGLDNDCDGVIDNSPAAATITCKSKGVCAGTTPLCMGQSGWVCKYPTLTYQEVENVDLGCDGLDNDCDGLTDEPFAIGKACVVGSGPCAGTGVWACDNTMAGKHTCVGSMKTPGVETCNGKDDDCDGKVDELDKVSDRTTDDKIVYVAAQNVTMFVYEATRYDAAPADHGFDSTRRPCSVPGKQPWTNVTKEEAEAACEKIGAGWRLCTATEWFDVCNGSGNTTFPYGAAYIGSRCNGYDFTFPAAAATTATGAATMCISDQSAAAGDEFFDMSGNVKEWVLSGAATATTGPYEMRGGAYDIASFSDNTVMPAVQRAPGLQCDASIPAPSTAVRLPSVGFRCCRTGMLPP